MKRWWNPSLVTAQRRDILDAVASEDELPPKKRFDLYVRRCDELIQEPAVQQGAFNIELSLRFERGGPLGVTSREPNEQLFRSFLITFRKFMSDGEDVYANRVNRLLHREVRSDELKGQLLTERQKWLNACKVGAFRLVENGRVLEPEQVMDLWINGSIFHNDRRKEEALDRLNPLHRLISKHAFLNHVITASQYVVFRSGDRAGSASGTAGLTC